MSDGPFDFKLNWERGKGTRFEAGCGCMLVIGAVLTAIAIFAAILILHATGVF